MLIKVKLLFLFSVLSIFSCNDTNYKKNSSKKVFSSDSILKENLNKSKFKSVFEVKGNDISIYKRVKKDSLIADSLKFYFIKSDIHNLIDSLREHKVVNVEYLNNIFILLKKHSQHDNNKVSDGFVDLLFFVLSYGKFYIAGENKFKEIQNLILEKYETDYSSGKFYYITNDAKDTSVILHQILLIR